jgi:hypothetical protein
LTPSVLFIPQRGFLFRRDSADYDLYISPKFWTVATLLEGQVAIKKEETNSSKESVLFRSSINSTIVMALLE